MGSGFRYYLLGSRVWEIRNNQRIEQRWSGNTKLKNCYWKHFQNKWKSRRWCSVAKGGDFIRTSDGTGGGNDKSLYFIRSSAQKTGMLGL